MIEMNVETHVVTISVGYCCGGEVHEVFRGSEDECQHLATRITCCSNDRRVVHSAMITCALISDWEAHKVNVRLQQHRMMLEGSDDEQD